jgi:hypothetical protein
LPRAAVNPGNLLAVLLLLLLQLPMSGVELLSTVSSFAAAAANISGVGLLNCLTKAALLVLPVPVPLADPVGVL